ncbi:MAG: aminotransferase class V-fold PLP-dependent enzyme [Treponema sp.]|jgi:cysteine desulfurase family protein|nr:aminotransferase class V-fold PLP-dependent enzyme [Treponema sp.]
MIYLDNAATSNKKPQCVIDAVVQALTEGIGNSGRGTSEAALEASRIVYRARKQTAGLFGFPDPSCVAFTSNSTEALNTAIMGTLSPGDRVVTTAAEHNSVLRPLFFQKNNGVQLDIVPLDENGVIRYDSLKGAVTADTKAVVITQASNVTGNYTDLAAVSTIIRNAARNGRRPLLIVDASQTAGSFAINAADTDGQGGRIDILCFTGHKALMGPQGTGGICVMPDIHVRPLKRGGSGILSFEPDQPDSMPVRLEAGTMNVHGLAGLAAAVDFIKTTGLKKIRTHEQNLLEQFYETVAPLPGIRIYGDFHKTAGGHLNERAPVISLNLGNHDAAKISDILFDEYGIATRAGAHCAPLVHRHFGTVSQGMVRFSFGWFTTEQEISAAAAALETIQKDLSEVHNE